MPMRTITLTKPMRQITNQITGAFLARKPAYRDNTSTDGQRLLLFGNVIAEHRPDGLYITTAGWPTTTTKDRLNALPGVRVHTAKGVLMLNGKKWDGAWTCVS